MSSFNHDIYQTELRHRLTVGHGWSDEIAVKVAQLASDVIRATHGGARHYIGARNTDREAIQAEYAAGASIASLSRRHGLTAMAIRNIVKK